MTSTDPEHHQRLACITAIVGVAVWLLALQWDGARWLLLNVQKNIQPVQ